MFKVLFINKAMAVLLKFLIVACCSIFSDETCIIFLF